MFNNTRNRADWSDKSSSQKGFTLIELLVVIAILGVLAVVGVLSFSGLTDSAKGSTAKTELTQVQTAVDAYAAKNGAAPADAAPLNVVTSLETAPNIYIKPGSKMQCSYDLAGGNVTFSATQTDPNCK